MVKAIWSLEYDYRVDQCYQMPVCADCGVPIMKYPDGKYKCASCGDEAKIDEKMKDWLDKRDGEKVVMKDCPQCGGKKCVETYMARNNVTLKWQTEWGECNKCGMAFIV